MISDVDAIRDTSDTGVPPDLAAPGSWSMYAGGADAEGNPVPAPTSSPPAAAPATRPASTTTKMAIGVGIVAIVLAAAVLAMPARRRR